MEPRIPLIEIKNSTLLQIASEADRKGNKNSLLDTSEEFNIFQNKAKNAIKFGLCSQKDYDDVMQIDAKKIKTQVTTMENLRDANLKNCPNGKDYNEKYYQEMKEKFKKEIEKYEKELPKVKKELDQAYNEYLKTQTEQAKFKYKKTLSKLSGVLMGVFLLLSPLSIYLAIPQLISLLATTQSSVDVSAMESEIASKIKNYQDLQDTYNNILNALNNAKDNFDLIANQNDFLENMENYVKILDQRDAYLKKLDEDNL